MNPRCLQAIPVLALLIAPHLFAQNDAPPDVRAFAAQYVAAFNAKDHARVESLCVPESRACITPANHDAYDAVLATDMLDPVPSQYQLSFMAVNQGNLKAVSTLGRFPVQPERELHIDYQYPNSNDGGQIDLYLVRRDGRWLSDFPCMNAASIQSVRDNIKGRERFKAMAAAINEPLRSQLLTMLRAHQSGEAESKYQQVQGGDMRTAMLVIDELKEEVH